MIDFVQLPVVVTNIPLVPPWGLSHSAENDKKIENFYFVKMCFEGFRNVIR